jgi:hypothetical protein
MITDATALVRDIVEREVKKYNTKRTWNQIWKGF